MFVFFLSLLGGYFLEEYIHGYDMLRYVME